VIKFLKTLFRYRLTDPDQERLDSELRVARDILFSLVPGSFPPYSAWREFDLHARFSPAREIGGDYYDFYMLNPDTLVIVVGDVSGKGVPAALYMAVIRTAFRSFARQAASPSRLMRDLNETLVRDNRSGLYVTLNCFFINLPDGKTEYVIAGHPAPMWHRAAEGTTAIIDSPRDTFVGMQPGLEFPAGTITLEKGDTLLLYTDGVTDAKGAAGMELDYAGLGDMFTGACAGPTCADTIRAMADSLADFTGGGEQADDTTLLAFRYWGPGGKMGGDLAASSDTNMFIRDDTA
jgi:sigma-B regulation protein RsbU (phosphoserine phosphatase)